MASHVNARSLGARRERYILRPVALLPAPIAGRNTFDEIRHATERWVSEAGSPAAFSAALEAVLERVLDPVVAGKLERVYTAADRCVAGLGTIDLSALEGDDEPEGADLGLWEKVAPAVGQTLGFVSTLIRTIQTDYPEQGGGEDGIDISLDDGDEIDPVEKAKSEESAYAVRAAGKSLQQQVAALGMGVRNPEVVASRWELLGLLQSSIGRFYGAIGDMVYASAVAFGEVKRSEIVPYHAERLKESLTLRRAAVDLGRVSGLYLQKLKGAVLSEMGPMLGQFERDLASFSKTPAYRSLWAKDKQTFLGFRSRMHAQSQSVETAEALRQTVEDFTRFAEGLAEVNQRVLVKDHDREMAAECAAKLEQAGQVLPVDPKAAAALVAEVLRCAWSLYGRDPELDAYLRQVKKRGAVRFTTETLAAEIAQASALVARVPVALFQM